MTFSCNISYTDILAVSISSDLSLSLSLPPAGNSWQYTRGGLANYGEGSGQLLYPRYVRHDWLLTGQGS